MIFFCMGGMCDCLATEQILLVNRIMMRTEEFCIGIFYMIFFTAVHTGNAELYLEGEIRTALVGGGLPSDSILVTGRRDRL